MRLCQGGGGASNVSGGAAQPGCGFFGSGGYLLYEITQGQVRARRVCARSCVRGVTHTHTHTTMLTDSVWSVGGGGWVMAAAGTWLRAATAVVCGTLRGGIVTPSHRHTATRHTQQQDNFEILELAPVLLLGVIGGLLGAAFTALNEQLAAWRKEGERARARLCAFWGAGG
jgi:hypothetical protein